MRDDGQHPGHENGSKIDAARAGVADPAPGAANAGNFDPSPVGRDSASLRSRAQEGRAFWQGAIAPVEALLPPGVDPKRLRQMPPTYRRSYVRAVRGGASLREAIKMQCAECCGYDREAVTECPATACPLWHYRPWQRRRATADAHTASSRGLPRHESTNAGEHVGRGGLERRGNRLASAHDEAGDERQDQGVEKEPPQVRNRITVPQPRHATGTIGRKPGELKA